MAITEISPEKFTSAARILGLEETMSPLESRTYDAFFGLDDSLGMADIWSDNMQIPALVFSKYWANRIEREFLGRVVSLDSYLEARRSALRHLALGHWAIHLTDENLLKWRPDMAHLIEDDSVWLMRWLFDAAGLAMRTEIDRIVYHGDEYQERMGVPEYPEMVNYWVEKFLPDTPSRAQPRKKIVAERADLIKKVGNFRDKGYRIVTFFGGFDIKHDGHGETLAKIRALGPFTKVVAVLAPDAEMRLLKGEKRPYQTLDARSRNMSYDQAVDLVYAATDGPAINFSTPGEILESRQHVVEWYEQLHIDICAHARVIGQAGENSMENLFLEECRKAGTMLLAVGGGRSISTTSLVERITSIHSVSG